MIHGNVVVFLALVDDEMRWDFMLALHVHDYFQFHLVVGNKKKSPLLNAGPQSILVHREYSTQVQRFLFHIMFRTCGVLFNSG